MKKYISIISLLLTLPTLALASAQSKAKELMELMEIRSNLDKSFEQVKGFSDQMIAMQNLTAEEEMEARQTMDASMQSSIDSMKEIDWEGMFAEVYASVFDEEELQGLIDFYRSPVGKKFIDKQPELTVATMQKMQVEFAKIMPQLQADALKAIEGARK